MVLPSSVFPLRISQTWTALLLAPSLSPSCSRDGVENWGHKKWKSRVERRIMYRKKQWDKKKPEGPFLCPGNYVRWYQVVLRSWPKLGQLEVILLSFTYTVKLIFLEVTHWRHTGCITADELTSGSRLKQGNFIADWDLDSKMLGWVFGVEQHQALSNRISVVRCHVSYWHRIMLCSVGDPVEFCNFVSSVIY